MTRSVIHTDQAPQAIGPYSQAVRCGNLVFLSGQIPLNPETMELVEGVEAQVRQVFDNLEAVCVAAGGALSNIAKLNIYLTDLGQFDVLNEIMSARFAEPYPARAAIEVSALPKGALVEMEAVLSLD
ncbi:RidA family protein [Cardiobacteriaceae bacterium TAE3-ERU3]|nr:RidA family protein [Cardiobacteriaceae bacterium TAE3-ERU3]